jgi:exosortase A-associated hydrolase 1
MSRWNEEPVVFECGGEKLVGILHRGASLDVGLGVLIVVGGPQYRVGSHRQFVQMARGLAAAGHPVMRFDYRGMGDSNGQPRTFESVEDDVRAAVQAFEAAMGQRLAGITLFGLCDAASAILMYGARTSHVCAVAVANPWVRSSAGEARSYVRHYYGHRLLQRAFWGKFFKGEVHVFRSVLDFIAALLRSGSNAAPLQGFVQSMLVGLQDFTGPVLVLSSGRDLTAREFEDLCSTDDAWRGAMARPNVTVARLDEADHTFSSGKDLRASIDALATWLREATERAPCR